MEDTTNAPAPTEVMIPIADIEVGARLRSVKDDKMKEIAASIAVIGLTHAIVVSRHPTKTTGDPPRPVYLLEAGAYRLEAHKHLGRTEIRANVTELTGDLLALVQTDENLMRADLDDLERADFLAARKEEGCGPRRGYEANGSVQVCTSDPIWVRGQDGRTT